MSYCTNQRNTKFRIQNIRIQFLLQIFVNDNLIESSDVYQKIFPLGESSKYAHLVFNVSCIEKLKLYPIHNTPTERPRPAFCINV